MYAPRQYQILLKRSVCCCRCQQCQSYVLSQQCQCYVLNWQLSSVSACAKVGGRSTDVIGQHGSQMRRHKVQPSRLASSELNARMHLFQALVAYRGPAFHGCPTSQLLCQLLSGGLVTSLRKDNRQQTWGCPSREAMPLPFAVPPLLTVSFSARFAQNSCTPGMPPLFAFSLTRLCIRVHTFGVEHRSGALNSAVTGLA